MCCRSVRNKGFVLITTGICAVAIMGMLGLSVDLGRLYIVRNEMQTYADSAALAAAVELDGTAAGLSRARAVVSSNANRWHLHSNTFTGTQLDFGTSSSGPWQANPSPAAGYAYARVRTQGSAPLYFMPVISGQTTSVVAARAVAGQVPQPVFREGLFPFSPLAHTSAAPDFGFTPGQIYTLRWGSNPKVGMNVCSGDDATPWVEHATQGSSSERGYIEETSSAIIRQAILDSYQSRPLSVGDTLIMTGGNKQTQRDALIARILQDTDSTSTTYSAYDSADTGNGRRLVAVAIGSGFPDDLLLGFGLFFLLVPSEYDAGGNRPFCAEYVGPYVQGSRRRGAGGSGAYAVRLAE